MKNKNARETVIDTLIKIEKQQTYLQLELKDALEDFSLQDRALITEISVGTMKYKLRIDYILNQYSKTPVNKMKPLIRQTLRMSVYQLLFMEKIPSSAAINEAVKIIHKRKMNRLSGFVNGVLRTIDRQKEQIEYPKESTLEYLSVYYSFPEWVLSMWLESYSYETVEKMCIALNERACVSARVNTLTASYEEVKRELELEGMGVEKSKLLEEVSLSIKGTGSIQHSPSFRAGKWTVQDESATLVGLVVDPKPKDRVLDMCSAPGGKTTHLAELMQNQGEIFATDIYPHKIELIQKNADRLKALTINSFVQDGTIIKKEWENTFDKVLLDAPCSGLGILKRKPDMRYTKTKEDILEISKIQKKLIHSAFAYLKTGGSLTYSTCTISAIENEEMVKYILDHYCVELEDIKTVLPKGLQTYVSDHKYIQILPHYYGTDGFFIAKFKKKG